MRVELICNGGYTGIEACIGKVFTAVPDGWNRDSVRIPVASLEQAGFIKDDSIATNLLFFKWEVRIIDG